MPYGVWDMVYKGRQGGWTERRGEKIQEREDNTDLWPVLKGQVDQEELIAKEGDQREKRETGTRGDRMFPGAETSHPEEVGYSLVEKARQTLQIGLLE